jgi:hypothetical protein
MKNTKKVCVIALVAIIGFSVTACFGSGGGSSGSSGGGTSRGSISPASDFEYQLNKEGTGVIISEYIGTGGSVVVPSEIEGFPVVSVVKLSGANPENITSIVLPDTVTKIGDESP